MRILSVCVGTAEQSWDGQKNTAGHLIRIFFVDLLGQMAEDVLTIWGLIAKFEWMKRTSRADRFRFLGLMETCNGMMFLQAPVVWSLLLGL